MKIALLLQRATDLKWAGPLAVDAIEAGHKITLIQLEGDRREAKSYLKIKDKDTSLLRKKGVKVQSIKNNEIDSLSSKKQIDFLIMQEGYHSQSSNLNVLQKLREKGVKIISLSHFFEICKRPIEALNSFDKTIYISEFARDLHFNLQAGEHKDGKEHAAFASKYAIAGSPMFDQIEEISREESRERLGIGKDERLVLLMAPVILPTTPWRFHVWRDERKLGRIRDAVKSAKLAYLREILFGDNFREVFWAIKSFCERNGAKLIVKSRGKQENLDFLEGEADIFLDGFTDEYFPHFSSYELMAASDLCITVNSMAAAEAAAAGLPCINIYVPHDDRAAKSSEAKDRYNQILLGANKYSLMNYPGAVKKVDRRKAKSFFERQSWGDALFPTTKREAYAAHFLGFSSERSGKKILSLLEEMQ